MIRAAISIRRFVVLGAALLVGGAVARCATAPHTEAEVPWPDGGTTVRVAIHGTLSAEWWVTARNARGSASASLWEDWGPARRANIYRTTDGSVAVIGAGSLAGVIGLPATGRPVALTHPDTRDGDAWQYLGGVVQSGGRLAFVPAEILRECIPLYGLGSVPVRAVYHDRSC